MIEILSLERCIECNICVKVCPTNVFALEPGGAPRIARHADCQTCFLCEAYCPADALYVAPDADATAAVHEHSASVQAQLGSYRTALGWGAGQHPSAVRDQSHRLLNPTH